MPFLHAPDQTSLYVKQWGSGDPVVFIHGWPLSSASWDPQLNAFADAGYTAIAYDRRGFGQSDQSDGPYTYDILADDLAAVIDQCTGDRQVALVGFSMGGGEIARYLSRHGSKRISRVALVSSIVPYMLQTDDNPDGVPQPTFDTMAQGMLDDNPHFMRGFFRDFFGQGIISKAVSSEMMDRAWQLSQMAGLRQTLAAAKAFSSTDFRPDLRSFDVPTLIIHGTADKTVPIEPSGRAAARGIPHSTLIEYDGAPHGLFATDSARLTNDLLMFMRGQAPALDATAGEQMVFAAEMLSPSGMG